MGNKGLGIGLILTCVFLVTMAHECVGWENLTTSCSQQERLALVKFKNSIHFDYGMLSSWGIDNDCCRWKGVGCDNATGRVVSLNLRRHAREDYGLVDRYSNLLAEEYNLGGENHGFFLRGDIPYYMFGGEVNFCTELVYLKHLDLSGNVFVGSQIPECIGSLKQLRYLNLSNADFKGTIPHQIGNLSHLKVLDLKSFDDSNGLMIDDMAWISSLSKLEHLDLTGVDLSRAHNVDSLLYMPSLLNLTLSRCGLSMAHLGSYHLNSSRELSSIKQLDLSENDFRGQLPGLFFNMTSLELLDLSLNNVSMSWNFENLLKTIPSILELRVSGCNIQKINLLPNNLSIITHSSIQHLDLSRNNIEGRFPSVLTNMSSVISLDLSYNSLNSSIIVMPNLLKLDISGNNFRQIHHVGIWRQCHLKELIASFNNLGGQITDPSTEASNCSQNALEILYLDHNKLSCSIPESLGRLINLRGLDLSFNELTGSVPVSLGKLTSLRVFSVASNLLNGTIPNSIGQLRKLYYLDVSNNSLQGVISEKHFANLSMLKYLNADYNNKLLFNISPEWIPPFQLKVVRLHSCKIEDGFPQWVRTQMKLQELVLSNSGISGPLPTWLHLMPKISILDLSHNKLTGPLTNLHSIYDASYEFGGILVLQNNLFEGVIPRWLCTRKNLKVLDLSRNRLTGTIPSCLWSIPLDMVILSSNRLSGVIPSPLDYSSSLQWLQLNDNNLSGELPRNSRYFSNLMVLDFGENKLSGSIPEWNLEELLVLRLHKNKLSGTIPYFLRHCSMLQVLDLAQNNLEGSIPSWFSLLDGMQKKNGHYMYWGLWGYGNVMQVLKGNTLNYTKNMMLVTNMDLSSNKLVGKIPEELTKLDALMGLNLSNNRFSGGIPKNIGNMISLNSLDLSANKLTGMIPPSMAALNFLSYLNLSHNKLSGQIPTGNQLQTLNDPSIYADNTYLCGAPLAMQCFPHKNTRSKNIHKNGKVWFYLDITIGFATGFWGIIGVLLLKKQLRHKLFMFSEVAIDNIYVAVAVRVLKMKRGCLEFK